MKSLLAIAFALLMPVAALAADASADATALQRLARIGRSGQLCAKAGPNSSSLMHARISADQWAQSAKPIHETLGPMVSREPTGVDFLKSLPGAPDADYAIVHFKTKFEKKADAKETVTMMMDGGKWKSAGYFIN